MEPKPDSFLTAESPFVIGFKILPDIRPANAYPYKGLTALRIRDATTTSLGHLLSSKWLFSASSGLASVLPGAVGHK
jgi:hypothetical protein